MYCISKGVRRVDSCQIINKLFIASTIILNPLLQKLGFNPTKEREIL